jgi:ribonuclease HII
MNLGIDDAGRGPVIGPMILAGVLIDPKYEKELALLGVKDSKQLTQKRRVFLAEKIKEVAEDFEVVITKATEIDSTSEKGINLNDLEAIKAAKIINRLNKGKEKIKVILDCPSTGIVKWNDYLKTKVEDLSNLEVSCEHKADKNHVSVAAASILAKCEREKEMDKLKKEYGNEIGSGYTSDSITIKFLAKFAEKHQDKGIFRKTWKTWKKAMEKLKQRTLS